MIFWSSWRLEMIVSERQQHPPSYPLLVPTKVGQIRLLIRKSLWLVPYLSCHSLKHRDFGCERSCAHLTGVVKSNSSGIEVWRGSLVQACSRSRCVLDRGAVETLYPPQCGLGVTGKSSTPRDKFLCQAWLLLLLTLFLVFTLSNLLY